MKRSFQVLGLWLAIFIITYAGAIPNFSFVQVSDTHAPSQQSKETISQLKNLGRVQLVPYELMSNTPSFIIVTGDMCEFGEEGWSAYLDFWKGVNLIRYDVLGNHDNTWSSLRNKLRDERGAPYYSFEYSGCHFIVLESATVQDPLPGFSKEELLWLKEDLKKVNRDTPIFLSFHHPLDTNEFVSPYERYRLLELFQPYNLACILVGHGHSARYLNFEGYDSVEGGSSFGNAAGFNLLTVSNNTLYVAYKLANSTTAEKALLKKSIYKTAETPNIVISTPEDNKLIGDSNFEVRSIAYKFPGTIVRAEYQIDDNKAEILTNAGTYYSATVPTDTMLNGVHYLKVLFSNSQATVYRTQRFVYEKKDGPKARWRYELAGSSKTTPVIDQNIVFVGGTDGVFYAIDQETGSKRWNYKTGGEILGTPAISGGMVYFGSGDGNLYALYTHGQLKWQFKADSPIYSSPVISNDIIYFGSKKGTFYAVDARSGGLKWKNSDATYTIEDQPLVYSDVVYYSAWDSYVYAVDIKNGKLIWKMQAAGSHHQPAKKYYSAGKGSPALTKSNVVMFISDRGWQLSAMQLDTGTLSWYTGNCLALKASEDKESLYVRTYAGDSQIQKLALDGSVIWSAPVQLSSTDKGRSVRYAVPPVEKNGKVYAVSCWGTLYCVDSKNGKVLWQYQTTPQLAVMSSPTIEDDGTVFVSSMDGTVTAVVGPK